MLITQTPLRVSFAGGGTDLAAFYRQEPGAVLSSAIDKFVYVIVKERFDERIVVGYMKKEVVDSVGEIRHELVREAMRKTGMGPGVEITTLADIPSEGSGLGSSSSLTVGLLNAFYAYQGVQVTAEQLAREACEIEIEVCGKPIGKQDQYIAAYGGLRFFSFNPDGSVAVEPVPIGRKRQELSANLLLYYTDITRQADPILTEQARNTPARADYLRGIKALAFRAREQLLSGNVDSVGEILRENWALKKEMAAGISNPRIEAMVETALAHGAAGCKICGAGGGGFLLAYCPHPRQNDLRKGMEAYREMPFFLERFGSRVIFNMHGYEWK